MQSKQSSIRAYAVIKHDKDKTDLHHHMVIRTHSNWTCQQVAKWFKPNGEEQNTFAQPVIDRNGILEYLTHENEDETKAKYDKSDIIDGGLDDLLPQEDCADNHDTNAAYGHSKEHHKNQIYRNHQLDGEFTEDGSDE